MLLAKALFSVPMKLDYLHPIDFVAEKKNIKLGWRVFCVVATLRQKSHVWIEIEPSSCYTCFEIAGWLRAIENFGGLKMCSSQSSVFLISFSKAVEGWLCWRLFWNPPWSEIVESTERDMTKTRNEASKTLSIRRKTTLSFTLLDLVRFLWELPNVS